MYVILQDYLLTFYSKRKSYCMFIVGRKQTTPEFPPLLRRGSCTGTDGTRRDTGTGIVPEPLRDGMAQARRVAQTDGVCRSRDNGGASRHTTLALVAIWPMTFGKSPESSSLNTWIWFLLLSRRWIISKLMIPIYPKILSSKISVTPSRTILMFIQLYSLNTAPPRRICSICCTMPWRTDLQSNLSTARENSFNTSISKRGKDVKCTIFIA